MHSYLLLLHHLRFHHFLRFLLLPRLVSSLVSHHRVSLVLLILEHVAVVFLSVKFPHPREGILFPLLFLGFADPRIDLLLNSGDNRLLVLLLLALVLLLLVLPLVFVASTSTISRRLGHAGARQTREGPSIILLDWIFLLHGDFVTLAQSGELVPVLFLGNVVLLRAFLLFFLFFFLISVILPFHIFFVRVESNLKLHLPLLPMFYPIMLAHLHFIFKDQQLALLIWFVTGEVSLSIMLHELQVVSKNLILRQIRVPTLQGSFPPLALADMAEIVFFLVMHIQSVLVIEVVISAEVAVRVVLLVVPPKLVAEIKSLLKEKHRLVL